MIKDTGKTALDEARDAAEEGNWPLALERYEYFFDHALDDDKHSFYGVRLSYCLREWARLGKEHPPATERLKERREQTLKALLECKEPELFHDYYGICRALETPELPVELFLRLHNEDREYAEEVIRFIWDDLVKNEYWETCSSYIGNPGKKYKGIIEHFDAGAKMFREDPRFSDTPQYLEYNERTFIKEVNAILLILGHTCQEELAATIRSRAVADLDSRGLRERCGELVGE